MNRTETTWTIVILLILVLITSLVMHSIGLENEVERLQEEKGILRDDIWSLKQHLTNEGVNVNE